MNNTNHLLRTLYVTRTICQDQPSMADLRERFDLSDRQLHRIMKEAQHLGAHFESVRSPDGYRWRCSNADAIHGKGLLDRWIELEENATLV